MSIHVAVGLFPVKRFDHKGLHQLQNSFVTDEDPRGQRSINMKGGDKLYCEGGC